MARQKKPKIRMCGGCYNDFEEQELKTAVININPSSEKNGQYLKYLCQKCQNDSNFKKRVICFTS